MSRAHFHSGLVLDDNCRSSFSIIDAVRRPWEVIKGSGATVGALVPVPNQLVPVSTCCWRTGTKSTGTGTHMLLRTSALLVPVPH